MINYSDSNKKSDCFQFVNFSSIIDQIILINLHVL